MGQSCLNYVLGITFDWSALKYAFLVSKFEGLTIRAATLLQPQSEQVFPAGTLSEP